MTMKKKLKIHKEIEAESKRKLKDALPQDVTEMTDLLGDAFRLVGVNQYGATQVVYLAKQ